mgnify:FL=1
MLGNSNFVAHFCCQRTMSSITPPEQDPIPPDEMEGLEQLHQKSKDEQEAWRNLLENLNKLKIERKKRNEPKKPNT